MANGSISGRVIDSRSKQPISGAQVHLTKDGYRDQTCNVEGNFRFDDTPPANDYRLDVGADGYETEHYEPVIVVEGSNTDLGLLSLSFTF